jgi:hypothetical protein
MSQGADMFDVTIPAQTVDSDIFYYISATNGNGKTIRKPLVAPAGLYRFYARGDGQNTYFPLTISVEGNGTVAPEIGEHMIIEGEQVPLSATPETQWRFTKWVVNEVEYFENPYFATINAATTAVAHFDFVGAVDNQIANKMRLYPNPGTNEITIENINGASMSEITITDISGNRALFVRKGTAQSQNIDISSLERGIYFIEVKTHEEKITLRFVKM